MREYSGDSCKLRDGSSVKVDQVESVGFPYSSWPKTGSHSSVKASRQVDSPPESLKRDVLMW